ncbi:MAG: hypothetical protein LUE29_04885 [Lachnospiraceae bacterium]|nr:hypothetical protein [Lachnospiraceae bacterium]
MNFLIIFLCVVIAVILFGIILNRHMFKNDRLIYAVLLMFLAVLFAAAGGYLFPAGAWRSIAIVLLIIGAVLFVAGVVVLMVRKK